MVLSTEDVSKLCSYQIGKIHIRYVHDKKYIFYHFTILSFYHFSTNVILAYRIPNRSARTITDAWSDIFDILKIWEKSKPSRYR